MFDSKEFEEFYKTCEWLENYIEKGVGSFLSLRAYLKDDREIGELFERDVYMDIDVEALPAVHIIEVMMHNLLIYRFAISIWWIDTWGLRIFAARYELVKLIGWNRKNNSYDREDIVKHIMDWYDEIYRDAAEEYMKEAGKDTNQVYGRKNCPKVCPWSLQDLIKAPYQDILKMIHPVNDKDAARLIKKCEFIKSLHDKVFS